MFELTKFENGFFKVNPIKMGKNILFFPSEVGDYLEYVDLSDSVQRRGNFVENIDYITFRGEELKSLKELCLHHRALDHRSVISPNVNAFTMLTESGFYAIAFRSGKYNDNVLKFRTWVTSEVLPTIRKYGLYATPQTTEAMIANPDEAIKYLKAIKREREARVIAEKKAAEAIRTKAWISDKKTATALQTASSAVRRANKIAKENEKLKSNVNKLKLAQGMQSSCQKYATTKRVAQALGVQKEFPWYFLRNYCIESGLKIRRIPHLTFGKVDSYPAEAWLDVYNVKLRKLF